MSEALLECTGLTMMFGKLAALDGLDIVVNKGDILGLVGPNGSGKTTFFNVVTGIYHKTSGSVLFEGKDLSGLSPQAIFRAGIARTFQRSRLCLDLTVFDNIMVGWHNAVNLGFWSNLFGRSTFLKEYHEGRERAAALLKSLNPVLVDQMDRAVGDLSMIDRRRVEICRAVIASPRLLLLDEPSAGMTEDETRQLMDEIVAMRDRGDNDWTIVLIEHEMNVIKRVTNRCIVLNFGQKLCEGPYEVVTADPVVREAYLGSEEL